MRQGLRRPYAQISGRAPSTRQRVVGRHRIRLVQRRRAHVEAHDRPEQRPEVLPIVERVERGAAVAEAEVEHAVRAEADRAAVLVEARLRDLEHDELAGRIGRVANHLDASEARRALPGREVVGPEPPVLLERRVEGDGEQPFALVDVDPFAQVEQRRPLAAVGRQHEHNAALLGDEHAPSREAATSIGRSNGRPPKAGAREMRGSSDGAAAGGSAGRSPSSQARRAAQPSPTAASSSGRRGTRGSVDTPARSACGTAARPRGGCRRRWSRG